MLLPLQGVTNERAFTQGVASLALGYALLPFQGVHYRLNPKLEFLRRIFQEKTILKIILVLAQSLGF